mmetsp:Transcript_2899/g.7070  ORF Transcript_2899/g.7070 Transcript_2899/m.7070 type:complete len:187 (-) Transcript_2899:126-686(-)|eukprot:CAMPEP_0177656436 /NCGR_PEP_ID=MMETSP0447-20121125/15570_1 /TAXON_ID=0 /ORGANISM="Stygamoeba regulata, Strain BSH-02190019" /LENGTH=186 /DNA_ID=CAMNT_0019160563 /DNA_START=48 /DNA_END=608 /DNA_ORIENTATION=-
MAVSGLPSLDLSALVGGPMIAIANAQTQSAMSTVEFVKQVCFDPATNEPVILSFRVESKHSTPEEPVYATLQIPFLCLVHPPFLRIFQASVDFRAKINSIEVPEHEVKQDTSMLQGLQHPNLRPRKFNVTPSRTSQAKGGNVVTGDYSLNIRVRMSSSDKPGAMDRIFDLLEMSVENSKLPLADKE